MSCFDDKEYLDDSYTKQSLSKLLTLEATPNLRSVDATLIEEEKNLQKMPQKKNFRNRIPGQAEAKEMQKNNDPLPPSPKIQLDRLKIPPNLDECLKHWKSTKLDFRDHSNNPKQKKGPEMVYLDSKISFLKTKVNKPKN